MLRRRLVVIALFLLAGAGSAYALSRDALWGVTQACVTGFRLTGLPFPCLTVNIGQGEQQGYAVVQLPFGDRDTVLMPTRHIIGIEDPSLAADTTPNYLAMAWAERGRLSQVTPRGLEQHDIGLAINSRLTRSQDQLHIHIACIKGILRPILPKIIPGFVPHTWTRVRGELLALQYWAYPLTPTELLNVNPFRLISELQPKITPHKDTITVALLGVGTAERPGFVLLTAATRVERGRKQSSAETLLDHSCAS